LVGEVELESDFSGEKVKIELSDDAFYAGDGYQAEGNGSLQEGENFLRDLSSGVFLALQMWIMEKIWNRH